MNIYAKILAKILARYLEKITPTTFPLSRPERLYKGSSLILQYYHLFNIIYGPSPPDQVDTEAILSLGAEKTFDWV